MALTQSPTATRITYVDGIRGVAIAMVLVFHSWGNLQIARPTSLFDFIASQGLQGVSLFFVVSGFCLSFPIWKRQRSGVARWFIPSEFFARRCLRILPPYYVALALFSAVKIVASHHHSQIFASREGPLTGPDVLAHVLLLHNLTPYINSINGMFWSLGLEWQWYWVFPLLLVLCMRSRALALMACLGLTVFWHLRVHDMWGLGALPPRLFEFCCGILAARSIANGRNLPTSGLVLGLVLPLSVIEIGQTSLLPQFSKVVVSLSLIQPLFGIAFASLILLGYHSSIANGVLSWRPLVWLGIASYSVYLVHGPILTRLYLVAPQAMKHSMLIVPVALVLGVVSGAIFHVLVERPCLRPSTWTRVTPTLVRLFGWTDLIWMRFIRREENEVAVASMPSPVARSG